MKGRLLPDVVIREGTAILELHAEVLEVEGLLYVVIRQSAPIVELLTGEDKALLVRGNAFLVLNLGLHIVDGVGGPRW